jgi:integrase
MERLPDDGWKQALEIYRSQADDLHAGRTPRVKSDGLTVADLLNRFLTSKLRKMESDKLSPRTFAEYRQTCHRLVSAFGRTRLVDDLAADDFEQLRADMAKRWGPVRVSNEITRVKGIFKYAIGNALIDRPVRFGSEFRKPGRSVMRKHRAESGKKLFTVSEIRALLDAASPQLRAAIFLGVNAGLGNMDVASLREKHIDLSSG